MPLANNLVLFTVEECQKNGQMEAQQNPKLPLVIALPVLVPFSCQPTPRELTVLRARKLFACLICCHDKSTDSVTFSIKIRCQMYESMSIVCKSYGTPQRLSACTNSQVLSPPLRAWEQGYAVVYMYMHILDTCLYSNRWVFIPLALVS